MNKLADIIHANSVSKGFYEDGEKIKNILLAYAWDDEPRMEQVRPLIDVVNRFVRNEKLLLIISEVIEVMEAYRKNTGEQTEEMADVIIRTLDLSSYDRIDIEQEVFDKMDKNAGRERKHGVGF